MEIVDIMEYMGLANLIASFYIWLTVLRNQ
jgi:hypothetical protein